MITASLPIKATGNITVTPTLSYIFPLSGDAKDEMKGRVLKGYGLAGRPRQLVSLRRVGVKLFVLVF